MASGTYIIVNGPGIFDLILSLFEGKQVYFKVREVGNEEQEVKKREWTVILTRIELACRDRKERIYGIAGETQVLRTSHTPSSRSAFYTFSGIYNANSRTGNIVVGSGD